MSRARHTSHVYVSGADIGDAVERLAWGWDDQRRQQWVTDQARLARQAVEMGAERKQLVGAIPSDVTAQLDRVRAEQTKIGRDLADLQTGSGRWADTPVRAAHLDLLQAQAAHRQAVGRAAEPRQGLLARRRNQQALEGANSDLRVADQRWEQVVGPQSDGLRAEQASLAGLQDKLEATGRARTDYIDSHPEVLARLRELNRAIDHQETRERNQSRTGQPAVPTRPPQPRTPPPPRHPQWAAPDPAQPTGPVL